MDSSPELDRSYERFQLIVNGPALFQAVVAALDLNIFAFLAEHPDSTVRELQDVTGLATHQLRVLMLALCATGLVVKHEGRYANAPITGPLLAEDRPDSWRNTLLGWRTFQYPAFAHLTSALRSATNTALASYPGDEPTLYGRLARDTALEASYHDSLGPFTVLFVQALLDNAELASVHHLLDVGGGDGTTAIAFAQRYPNARVTIFDMPSVTRHAELSVPAELADRVRMHAGDIFDDPFPGDVDGILFSHVLEPFSAEKNLRLLSKAYDALAPGGKLFAYGMTAPDDEQGGLLAARLSLYLTALVSGEGMAHSAKEYERWLTEVGCRSVKAFTGLPYEHGLVVGVKE
jgi:SAM-dependent methyltransferase